MTKASFCKASLAAIWLWVGLLAVACESSGGEDVDATVRAAVDATVGAGGTGGDRSDPAGSTAATPSPGATATPEPPPTPSNRVVEYGQQPPLAEGNGYESIEGISVVLDRVEFEKTRTVWRFSVWNQNQVTTNFRHLHEWRATGSRFEDPYMVDDRGNRYDAVQTPEQVDPVPGERQDAVLVFEGVDPAAGQVTLHLAATARWCIIGFCNDAIVWEPISIGVP